MSDRQYERVPLGLEVEFRTAGAFLVAYSSNLSKGGMFLETGDPLPIGTELTLRFAVPGEGSSLEVRGVVAWVQAWKAGDKQQGMGIRFEQLDGRHGEVIDRIVAGFRGLRVIVLATNQQSRAILARAVRSILSAAEVVEIADADAAEESLKKDADLAVIDLDDEDPEVNDGLLALRLAKASGRPLPVIATAHQPKDRARAQELGADEVLANPPSFPDLQAAVVRTLGRPAGMKRSGGDLP